ncbi:Multidrug resistance protein 3 [Pleomorphomonas sp. T1.2MG-36]|uniref:MDR family MFS transporter n=1 Tax=Pleomorphomonas sp. T1.2MG-36 TaxID=3041167 RepID=UPI0024779092|nr:MDR family MFS transporter [Pleomorphomonas sp. T1.2MG-36]CAI9402875.1 Multidrug resistance protein 3 [Pleomorphomonas sp. T1.2MG-36]
MTHTTDQPVLTEDDKTKIVVTALLCMFLAALDQTIVTPALPIMGASLGGGEWVSWIVSAYFLTATAVTPLYGKLADLKGRRPVLYAGVGIFVAGSLISAMAPTMAVLIAGRALQGLGGGGLMALVQTIIGDVAPPRERGKYMVYISAVWATSSIAGPVLGGLLAEYVHWSAIFWLNLPLGIVAVSLSMKPLSRLPDIRRDHRLDIQGALMIMAATLLFLLPLTLGGHAYPWSSPLILSMLVASAATFVLFAWYQFQPEEPLLPPRIFGDRVIALTSATSFLAAAGMFGFSVYYPVYLQLIDGLGASAAGLALLGPMLGSVAGSSISARILRKGKHYKRLPMIGSALSMVSLAVVGLLAGDVSFWVIEALAALTAFGQGTLFPVGTVMVQNAANPRDLGTATGAYTFVRSLGSVVAIAVLGAIVGSAGIGEHISEGALAPEARESAVAAFRALFFAAAAAQLLSLALLSRIEERPLRGRTPPPVDE